MKTKIILLLGILFAIGSNNLSAQNWDKISKQIKRKQLHVPPGREYVNFYYNLRKDTGYLNKFSPVAENDTIYIIDFYGVLSLDGLVSIVWNKSDTIVCASDNLGNTYQYEKNRLFTKYLMKLVGEWNIKEIRKEEKGKDVMLQETNVATRIIFNKEKCKINTIYFKNFFNIDRDGMDFQY